MRAAHYFTAADDGLVQEWRGRIWLNPPYAQPLIAHFVDKLVAEVQAERVSAAIMLTHNYTDTGWFHAAAAEADVICFTRGRIGFLDSSGKLAQPTQGQAFFYFGEAGDDFTARFSEHGICLFP